MKDLFQKIQQDSKNSLTNIFDLYGVEDSSNISFNKDDTYRVVSEATTNLKTKEDFILRSLIDQSVLNINRSRVNEKQNIKYSNNVNIEFETDSQEGDANKTGEVGEFTTGSILNFYERNKSSGSKNKWKDRSFQRQLQ